MGFYWLHWAFLAQLFHTHPWGLWACHQSRTLFACIALGLPRPILIFFHIIHCLWVCYSLFLSFWALLSPFTFSRPIYLFHGPVIHYSCRLDLMVFVLCLLPTSFRSVLLGWASFLSFGSHTKKRPSTFSPLNIWSIPAVHMWIEDLPVPSTSLLSFLSRAFLNYGPLLIYIYIYIYFFSCREQ